MKIVYLASNVGLISETFISDLLEGLAEAQSITVLCNGSLHKRISKLYRVEEISFLNLTSKLDRLQYRLNSFRGKSGAAYNYQIRLNHAYRTLIPPLQHHQPHVAYIDYGTVAVLARAALKKLKIPFVVHFHGADITSALENEAYRQELASLFKDASALVAASHHIRRLLVLEGAPANKIYVVRCGINLEKTEPMSWDKRKDHPPSIVFLGRFTPKKHPIALLEAFALVKQQIQEARLSMIGDGSEMLRVRQRIEQLNLNDSIKLYGALPRSEALKVVNRHWVFAQHSVTALTGDQEGFGLSLAEAAALGLPVVSTLHNGIPEQIIDGETGFLVREFDYEAMAQRLIMLLQNPKLVEQMGKVGCENIQDLCGFNRRIGEIEAILATACHI